MIPLPLGELESATLVHGDPELAVTSLVCDSRLARPGSLFACLRGAQVDGHDFIGQAARRGATAVLCGRGRAPRAGPLAALETDDSLATLAEIARLVRRRSRARVIGVAGSAGKTTLKDALQALLAPHLSTVASAASYNNELGVPLTLARLEPDTAACICELGTGAPRELAALCATAQPDLGVLTAVGAEHLEFFGSMAAVAVEEAALIAALPPAATVVLPFGEPLLEPFRRPELDEWRFGLDPAADVYPLTWRPGAAATDTVLAVRGERVGFTTNLCLPHHRLTLAAAAAVYAALGLPLDRIGDGAETIELSPWRGQEQHLPQGALLINDAYNANPVSLRAALEALAARRNGGRAIAVLGPMAELGPEGPRWHLLAGRQAADLGVDLLVAVGDGARGYLDGATGRTACLWFPDNDPAVAALRSLLRRDDVVLLKGSRTAHLERLALKLEGANPCGSLKDRTAQSLIDDLEQRGRLERGSILVESTSGNLGVALASLARRRGYRFVAVIDPKTTPENIARLRRLGARIELVETPDKAGGYLLARLERVRQLCACSHAFVWPDQYSNPANPCAHEQGTGPELAQLDGELDAVFIPVSTGGTLAGIARFLRRESPGTRVVAVDAHGSVALRGSAGPRLLTGVGANRRSAFVTADLYDDLVLVRDAEAFACCRALATRTGIRAGGSSGATLAACARLLARNPELERVACLCPDRGQSYATTIYSDRWLADNGIRLAASDLGPIEEIAPAATPVPA